MSAGRAVLIAAAGLGLIASCAACGHDPPPPAMTAPSLPAEVAAALPRTEGVQPHGGLAFATFLDSRQEDVPHDERRHLARWLSDPRGFRLHGHADEEAFLALAGAFTAARSAQPLLVETTAWVACPTWRSGAGGIDADAGLLALQRRLLDTVEAWNVATPTRALLVPFTWRRQPGSERPPDVFGVRLGTGPRRLSVFAHVDTVGPGGEDWEPLVARPVFEDLAGRRELLLRGRGAVDDKGPAVTALLWLESLRAILGDSELLNEFTFEVAFDTAEETSMQMGAWLTATGPPEAGVVLDAVWSVWAEKGGEATRFAVQPDPAPAATRAAAGPRVVRLVTPDGPPNQIPSSAEAWLAASNKGAEADLERLTRALEAFAEIWRGAEDVLTAWTSDGDLRLLARGSGAAHASAVEVSRRLGNNPLTCLCSFLAFCAGDPVPAGALATDGVGAPSRAQGWLAPSDELLMARFVNWTFGREVLGQQHPDLLRSADEVFTDGTTYAVTRLDRRGVLAVDVRYALGHHATVWDRQQFGLLPGNSRFEQTWNQLRAQFAAALPGAGERVTVITSTWAAPDIKDRDCAAWIALQRSFEAELGRPSPQLAIGGGTDAKGWPMLLACGPNFGATAEEVFAPPVNYHGTNESVPVRHLLDSLRVLVRWALVSTVAGE